MINHPDAAPGACFRIPATRLGYFIFLIAIAFLLMSCSALPDIPWLSRSATIPSIATLTPFISTPSPTVEINLAAFNKTPTLVGTIAQTGVPEVSKSVDTQTPTPAPKITSDLLFLSKDRLMRWDHVTGFMVPLIEGVEDYSADQDVHWITLLRPTNVSANGVALYNVDLLDMKTKQITNLLKGISRLDEILISPDGHWIVYQESRDQYSELFALSILQPDQPKKLGTCNPTEGNYCKTVLWSPLSNAILWEDSHGIWLSNLDKSRTSLLTSHEIDIIDPKGKKSVLSIVFQGLSWAPGGRYLLSEILTPAGVCWYAVFDVHQIHWTEVPDTFANSCPAHASASWTYQGNLLVVKPRETPGRLYPVVDIWQIVPTKNELFDLLLETELNGIQTDAAQNPGSEMDYSMLWPKQINQQVIGFGFLPARSSPSTDLCLANLDNEQIDLLARISGNVKSVLWSPDGFGALVEKDDGSALFASPYEAALIDLTSSSNGEARKFTWTPPTPRS